MGAHPKAPSRIVEPPGLGTLDRAIARDPVALLGREVCTRFGSELPFLFKVLAAAEPLSIQAHPDGEQARAGFRRENEAGLPLDAPERNYRDPNHKPELVCALTPFDAFFGFRPKDEVARRLAPLADEPLTAILRRTSSASIALRAVLQRLLTLDGAPKSALLARARREAERRAEDSAWGWVGRLLARHPDDTGALAPLYLNLVSLRPGQALYLPARELHAYLGGTALEVMASSDNVLRGGLTPKHVDVAELLATLVFEPHAPEVLEGSESGGGERLYRTPAREFELGLVDVRAGRPYRPRERRGLEILLGLEGDLSLRADHGPVSLARGRCLLVPASLTRYELSGSGRLARVRVPA
jgi:mannose-6-phosphate isomerase